MKIGNCADEHLGRNALDAAHGGSKDQQNGGEEEQEAAAAFVPEAGCSEEAQSHDETLHTPIVQVSTGE